MKPYATRHVPQLLRAIRNRRGDVIPWPLWLNRAPQKGGEA